MQLTGKEILDAIKCFETLGGQKLKVSLKVKIARNLQILRPLKAALDEARDGSHIEGAGEFLRRRQMAKTLEELEELKEEMSETYAEILKLDAEFVAELKKPVDIEIIVLDLSEFPDELETDIEPILRYLA